MELQSQQPCATLEFPGPFCIDFWGTSSLPSTHSLLYQFPLRRGFTSRTHSLRYCGRALMRVPGNTSFTIKQARHWILANNFPVYTLSRKLPTQCSHTQEQARSKNCRPTDLHKASPERTHCKLDRSLKGFPKYINLSIFYGMFSSQLFTLWSGQ